jgi:hypothetical protein
LQFVLPADVSFIHISVKNIFILSDKILLAMELFVVTNFILNSFCHSMFESSFGVKIYIIYNNTLCRDRYLFSSRCQDRKEGCVTNMEMWSKKIEGRILFRSGQRNIEKYQRRR